MLSLGSFACDIPQFGFEIRASLALSGARKFLRIAKGGAECWIQASQNP